MKRAAQSPIDNQRKTKKAKKEVEIIPDEKTEFLEDTSISFIAGIKHSGAIPIRDTTLIQKTFEQVEKVYVEMSKQSKTEDLTNMFQQLKKINERITNTEVKMALIGQPGAGKSRAANQILFSQMYMHQLSNLDSWGTIPLISGAGDHITRKVFYLKKGPEWVIRPRWDKNSSETMPEVNLMKKYPFSKKHHPLHIMTSILRKVDPTLSNMNLAHSLKNVDDIKELMENLAKQPRIFTVEEWDKIVAFDIESPDFELQPGFVLMDTPGFGFTDGKLSREQQMAVVQVTREAMDEADALIYCTSRLPNLNQMKVLFDSEIGAINTFREVPVFVSLWESHEAVKETDAKTMLDHIRRLKSDWNAVLPRASAVSKVGTQFDYFYERKRIFEQLEQRTLLFTIPGTLPGLKSFFQNVKSRVLMNDVVSFTRTVTTFYYGGKQWAKKIMQPKNQNQNHVVPTALSSESETSATLTNAYQEPIEDAKQAFVQTLEDYFQFLIQESEDEIEIYLDNLCKDIGTCFSQFFKDIQTQSLKMVDNLIKRVATQVSEANQREETELFITSIMEGMETQMRVFHTMRLRSDRIFESARKEIVEIYRRMRSEGQFADLQDFDEDDIVPYKKKFVSEALQRLIALMERCYKQMIQRTYGIIQKCGDVLREFAGLQISNTGQYEKSLNGLREAVDAYKATIKSQTPTEFKEFGINDPIPRVIKGQDLFGVPLRKKSKKPAEKFMKVTEESPSDKLADNVLEVSIPDSPPFNFALTMTAGFKKKIEEFQQISEAKMLLKDKKDDDQHTYNTNSLLDGTPTLKRKIIPEPIILLGDFTEPAVIGLKNILGAKVLLLIVVLKKYVKNVKKSLADEDVPLEIKNDVVIVSISHPKDLTKLNVFSTLLDVSKAIMEHWRFSFYWRFSLNAFNSCREYYLPVDTTRSAPLVRCLRFCTDVLAGYYSACIDKVHAKVEEPASNELISELFIAGIPSNYTMKTFTPEIKKALRQKNFQLLDRVKKRECSFQELVSLVENLDDLVDKVNREQYEFVQSLKDTLKHVTMFTLGEDRAMLKETRSAFPMLFKTVTSASRVTLNNMFALKGLWFRKKNPMKPFDALGEAEKSKDFYDGLMKAEKKLKDTKSYLTTKITYFGYTLRKDC